MPLDLPPIVGIASVIDGDTIEIHDTRIRLFGIDAPESRQICLLNDKPYMCGQKSANYLDTMIAGKTVKCVPKTYDRYQRIVAHCFVGEIDIQAEMVKSGQALAFIKYSKQYVAEQNQAWERKSGIWQSVFEMPWDWRKHK